MRKLLILFALTLSALFVQAQKIVPDIGDIKKPKNGKLYFSETENKLTIYVNKQFFTLFQAPKDSVIPPDPEPPVPPIIDKEQEIGYWDTKDKVLVLYEINGGIWLMQKPPDGSYYVARGKNLLDDNRTVVLATVDKNSISGGNTGLGGLIAPDDFPEAAFLKETGRVKNSYGEYVKEQAGGGGGESTEKISKPVGVIRWDGYFTTMVPDDPVDITKETRYALSDERTKDQAPFYSTFHETEHLRKQYWNSETKQWEWPTSVPVTVRFDGDRPGVIEKEVDYAVSAGIDYFLFNYYATGQTPMARGREQFEALSDKKGLKAAYIMENIGGDPDNEAKLIANAMRQDWYQKIEGKPLLSLPASGSDDFDRVYGIYQRIKAAYGGELYTILQMMGSPAELASEIRKRGYNSHSRYMTWGGWNEGDRSHRYIMDREWDYFQESVDQPVDFSPNVTASFYQVGAQKSWGGQPDYWYSDKATDAEFEEQIIRLAGYCNENSAKVKTVIIYSWNEFTEGGRTVCPQLRRDGTLDDRILKILAKYVE